MPKAKPWLIKKEQKNLFTFLCLLTLNIFLALSFFILPEDFFIQHNWKLCLWRTLTGKPCWGCGSLRAFSAFFHGHFTQAWSYNPLIYLWLTLLLLSQIYFLLRFILTHAQKHHS